MAMSLGLRRLSKYRTLTFLPTLARPSNIPPFLPTLIAQPLLSPPPPPPPPSPLLVMFYHERKKNLTKLAKRGSVHALEPCDTCGLKLPKTERFTHEQMHDRGELDDDGRKTSLWSVDTEIFMESRGVKPQYKMYFSEGEGPADYKEKEDDDENETGKGKKKGGKRGRKGRN